MLLWTSISETPAVNLKPKVAEITSLSNH
jgi:hypothetical protein